jgi:hypothetical protein
VELVPWASSPGSGAYGVIAAAARPPPGDHVNVTREPREQRLDFKSVKRVLGHP